MLDKPQTHPNDLSIRENEVLQLLVQGLSNKSIGREVGLAERTIEIYLRSLRKKIGAANRTHLAALAVGLRMARIVEPVRAPQC